MKRRHYTPEFKCRVAKEAIEVGNYSVVARRYNLHQSMVGRWARQYNEEGELAFERANARYPPVMDMPTTPRNYENSNERMKDLRTCWVRKTSRLRFCVIS